MHAVVYKQSQIELELLGYTFDNIQDIRDSLKYDYPESNVTYLKPYLLRIDYEDNIFYAAYVRNRNGIKIVEVKSYC